MPTAKSEKRKKKKTLQQRMKTNGHSDAYRLANKFPTKYSYKIIIIFSYFNDLLFLTY